MGNTPLPCTNVGDAPVHPHTHGEHTLQEAASALVTGSSPHAWGTHPQYNIFSRRSRFIPTRMGNTLLPGWSGSQGSVHPHTHGEHACSAIHPTPFLGSSPHAWGTHMKFEIGYDTGRFIPTRMGNTVFGRGHPHVFPVHPHTHGEHLAPVRVGTSACGSSPHAWGTRIHSTRRF